MGLFDLNKRREEYSQTEDEKKLVNHVKQKVEESRSSANRVAFEAGCMTNIAYLCGVNNVTFNTNTRQFQPVNRAGAYLSKSRIHVNKILPTVQNRLARLCKNPPKYDVRPESNDTDDKEAARLSLQVLTCLWDKLSLDKKRFLLSMWVQQCGHGWVKVGWDPLLGKMMTNPLTSENGYEGDVRADVVSPFEIFPDPMAKTDDDVLSSWLIQCKVRKLDYFKAQYSKRGDEVKAEDAWLLSAQYEQRINSLNSKGGGGGSGTPESLKNTAIEMIKYEARSEKYPNGRMIICANGILLDDKELPVGEIPFRKFDDIMIAGKFYSEAIVTHLRPIQDQYNETIRKRSEWTRQLLAGKYHAFRGSALGQEAMNDESGEVVLTDYMPGVPDGGKPTPLPVPNIPQYAYQEEEHLTQMFNDISGISEVSRGTLPSASIPAIGMQLLTEQDDTRIGVMTEQHEHAWAGVGSLILKHVERFYEMPRKLKIAGDKLQYTVKEISGGDLRGNTDVIVIRGSTLPGSKTLRRQEILNTYSQGLLGDPNDPKVREKVLGMIEFGDTQGMWEDYGLDMSQIKRGIDMLESGELPPISEFDNHALWVQELNRYRKGDKFESLEPGKREAFMSCIEAHIQAIMKLSGVAPPPPGAPAPGTGPLPGSTAPGGPPPPEPNSAPPPPPPDQAPPMPAAGGF